MSKRNFEMMDKNELRAACKAAGIGYSKLNVAGMREALAKRAPATKVEARVFADADNNGATAERETRNGVTRRKEGGICAKVWDALDQMHASGVLPSSSQVKALAHQNGWNENNALCELSAWRRFNGIARAQKRSPPVSTDGEVDQYLA